MISPNRAESVLLQWLNVDQEKVFDPNFISPKGIFLCLISFHRVIVVQ